MLASARGSSRHGKAPGASIARPYGLTRFTFPQAHLIPHPASAATTRQVAGARAKFQSIGTRWVWISQCTLASSIQLSGARALKTQTLATAQSRAGGRRWRAMQTPNAAASAAAPMPSSAPGARLTGPSCSTGSAEERYRHATAKALIS